MDSISNISKHRASLMGCAILWVMCYHFWGKDCEVSYGNVMWSFGHAGVDIFLFCSGFGLCYTYLTKINDINGFFSFVRKRIIRIIPTYWVIILISDLIRGTNVSDLAWKLSCIGFWVGKPAYDWYIPSLLVLYCMFAAFCILANKRSFSFSAATFILIGILATALLIIIGKGTVILFFSRIPIFFIGCIFGHLFLQKKSITQKTECFIILIAFILIAIECWLSLNYDDVFLRKTSLHHLPFACIVPGMCLFFGRIAHNVSDNITGQSILNLLSILGTCSLEIYLIHMSLRMQPDYIYFPLAVLAGVIFHFTYKKITKLL